MKLSWFAVIPWFSVRAWGQIFDGPPKYTLGFEAPEAGCGGTLSGEPGSARRFEVFAKLIYENSPTTRDVGGWSIAFCRGTPDVSYLPRAAQYHGAVRSAQTVAPAAASTKR